VSNARLIAVDWGTTALRSYVVSATGEIIARHESGEGILAVAKGDFAAVLSRTVAQLPAIDQSLPIMMSGMIGSRQGWLEAAYVRCPAGLLDLAVRLSEVQSPLAHDVFLVPGLDTRGADGIPDVMRGEETQILGALAALDLDDGLFVLPGTHSKWATVSGGRITGFATYMTGEVFAVLRDHTILGRLMAAGGEADAEFERGVNASLAAGAPGQLLHQIFSARTLCLTGDLTESGVEPYLSGLLIGSEIRAAARANDQPVYIMAGSTLAALYAKAAGIVGLTTVAVDGDSIVRAHLALANAANI